MAGPPGRIQGLSITPGGGGPAGMPCGGPIGGKGGGPPKGPGGACAPAEHTSEASNAARAKLVIGPGVFITLTSTPV